MNIIFHDDVQYDQKFGAYLKIDFAFCVFLYQ